MQKLLVVIEFLDDKTKDSPPPPHPTHTSSQNKCPHLRLFDSHNVKNEDGQDHQAGDADDDVTHHHQSAAEVDISWNAFVKWDHSSCEMWFANNMTKLSFGTRHSYNHLALHRHKANNTVNQRHRDLQNNISISAALLQNLVFI